MAVAMTTFGSTLSDLQKLTNDDRALDYSRANFQDDINARRLSDFLKARSEENKTKAQRDFDAARMLDAQQARAQQGAQFNTQQQNLMTLEGQRIAADKELQGMAGMNALEIAKLQANNRQMDPRMFQALGDIQMFNQEEQQKAKYAQQLSNARKATLAAKTGPMQASEDAWGPYNPTYRKRVSDADVALKQLDATAASLGLAVAPDGGYIIPEVMQVPAIFNQSPSQPTPTPAPAPTPQTPTPVTPAPASDSLPFLGNFFTRPLGGMDAPTAPVAPSRRFRELPDGRTIVVP